MPSLEFRLMPGRLVRQPCCYCHTHVLLPLSHLPQPHIIGRLVCHTCCYCHTVTHSLLPLSHTCCSCWNSVVHYAVLTLVMCSAVPSQAASCATQVVLNNEDGVREEHLRALCDIGRSTKARVCGWRPPTLVPPPRPPSPLSPAPYPLALHPLHPTLPPCPTAPP